MAYLFVMCDMPMQLGANSAFPKQFRNIPDNLHLFLTNDYIFFFTITLQLTVCLTLINGNIFSNMIFTSIKIFGQIS